MLKRGLAFVSASMVAALVAVALVLSGVIGAPVGQASAPPSNPLQVPTLPGDPTAGAVPDSSCQTGSREPGLQGEVRLKDRQDGRSEKGFACNLSLVGQYQGDGASWVSQSYKACAYMSAGFPSDKIGSQPGVRVIDASDQAHPKLSEVLTSPAMQTGTWESLKVNAARGLLAAVSGGPVEGAGFFDVYDISKDCAHPKLLNSLKSTALELPANGIGHEGGWAPDGMTYYSASLGGGQVTAIDVSDPTNPKILWTGLPNLENHGFSLSPDGNTLYLANIVNGAGVDVFNVSQIQHRYTLPQVSFIGGAHWSDGSTTQATIPITYHGVPYVIAWDELGNGGVRFINITDPQYPTIAHYIRLSVNMPKNSSAVAADTANTGTFGYQSHYCAVDRQVNPTALACGWFQSGVRVFDIRNILHPREIAYFNPPAQTGKNLQLPDSEHAQGAGVGGGPHNVNNTQLTADWCSSPPSFVGDELRVTCQDNGFMILKFAPGVLPISAWASSDR